MPTKTPPKGKKSAAKDSAPKKARAKRVEEGEPPAEREEVDAPPAVAVKKPAAPRARFGVSEVEPPPVVPARRLTPEAKARVNEMVKKGVSLQEALRAAASWETFVAPVKEEPPKLVQGKGDGAPKAAAEEDDGPEIADKDDDDDEPAAADGED